jgi:hypothetical protein
LLSNELINILRSPDTIKVLTTINEDGTPHTVFKNSITYLDKKIAYIELIETSLTARNMLRSKWFNKIVIISIYNPVKNAQYEIKGKPYKFLFTGEIWEKLLNEARKNIPDVNPTGVWLIEPIEVRNESYEVRLSEEDKRRPGSNFWLRYMETRKKN